MFHRPTLPALMTVTALLCAPPGAQAQPNEKTQDFIAQAAVGNLFEIESSKIALEKAQRVDVRDFAQRMIDDHTKAGLDMKEAVANGVPGLTPPQTLDDDHQDMIKDLQEADLDDFDEDYIEMQVDAHDDAVSLFEDYADDGNNVPLHQFAAETLPILREHQTRIKQIDDVD
jgi:putative membrane protein